MMSSSSSAAAAEQQSPYDQRAIAQLVASFPALERDVIELVFLQTGNLQVSEMHLRELTSSTVSQSREHQQPTQSEASHNNQHSSPITRNFTSNSMPPLKEPEVQRRVFVDVPVVRPKTSQQKPSNHIGSAESGDVSQSSGASAPSYHTGGRDFFTGSAPQRNQRSAAPDVRRTRYDWRMLREVSNVPVSHYTHLYHNPETGPPSVGIKYLIIMRGLPGSGKSTLAKVIVRNCGSGVVLSTDDYFLDPHGVYEFKSELLGRAHLWNKIRAQTAAEDGKSPIIIDNTNLTMWEMKPYTGIARQFGYVLIVREPDTPWRNKVAALAAKNTHGVTPQHIQQMKTKYRPVTAEELMDAWLADQAKREQQMRQPPAAQPHSAQSPANIRAPLLRPQRPLMAPRSGTALPPPMTRFTPVPGSVNGTIRTPVIRPLSTNIISNPTLYTQLSSRIPQNSAESASLRAAPSRSSTIQPIKPPCDSGQAMEMNVSTSAAGSQIAPITLPDDSSESEESPVKPSPPKATQKGGILSSETDPKIAEWMALQLTNLSVEAPEFTPQFQNNTYRNPPGAYTQSDMTAPIREIAQMLLDIFPNQTMHGIAALLDKHNNEVDEVIEELIARREVPPLKELSLRIVLNNPGFGSDESAVVMLKSSVEKSQLEQTYIQISDDEDMSPEEDFAPADVTLTDEAVIPDEPIVVDSDGVRTNFGGILTLDASLASSLIAKFGAFDGWQGNKQVVLNEQQARSLYDSWKQTTVESGIPTGSQPESPERSITPASISRSDSVPESSNARNNAVGNNRVVFDLASSDSNAEMMSPPQSKKKKRKLHGSPLPASALFASAPPRRPLGDVSPVTSMTDIMNEEVRADASLLAQNQTLHTMNQASGVAPAAAALMKKSQLMQLFSNVEDSAIDGALECCNYSFKQAVDLLSFQFGEPSPDALKNSSIVLTDNPGPSEPGPSYLAAAVDVAASKSSPKPSRARDTAGASSQAGGGEVPESVAELDYQNLRREANVFRELRREELEKARSATGLARHQVAAYHASKAFQYTELMKEANQRAAIMLVEQSKKNRGNAVNEVDLHGLHVEEALVVVKNHLLQLTTPEMRRQGVTEMRIITGWGKNNQGVSRIKPAIMKKLKEEGFKFTLENKGSIIVDLMT